MMPTSGDSYLQSCRVEQGRIEDVHAAREVFGAARGNPLRYTEQP